MQMPDTRARDPRLVSLLARFLGLLLAAVLAAACTASNEPVAATAPPAPLQIGQENVVTVNSGTVVVGPIVSGELRPQREATIRAELGGSMLEVAVDEGQAVSRGALLGRIETRTLDDV